MRRRLFNFAAAVSLLLCLATVGLSVRSKSRADAAWLAHQHVFLSIYSYPGNLNYEVAFPFPAAEPFQHVSDEVQRHDNVWLRAPAVSIWDYKQWNGWGIECLHGPMAAALDEHGNVMRLNNPAVGFGQHQASMSFVSVTVPFRLLIPALLLLPMITGIAFLRRHCGTTRNCCSTCGYNLTGNTSGVCPECGTPVVKAGTEQ